MVGVVILITVIAVGVLLVIADVEDDE